MAIVNVTEATFEAEVLNASEPVLVDFNAGWCGPCRMLKPTLEAVDRSNPGFKIVSVDVDENMGLAEEYGVSSIPCLLVFKGGAEVNRSVGLIAAPEILRLVEG